MHPLKGMFCVILRLFLLHVVGCPLCFFWFCFYLFSFQHYLWCLCNHLTKLSIIQCLLDQNFLSGVAVKQRCYKYLGLRISFFPMSGKVWSHTINPFITTIIVIIVITKFVLGSIMHIGGLFQILICLDMKIFSNMYWTLICSDARDIIALNLLDESSERLASAENRVNWWCQCWWVRYKLKQPRKAKQRGH